MKSDVYYTKTKNIAISQLIQQYQSDIDFLMYIMIQICSDIIYTMSILSQHSHNSDKTHWKVLKQVFHYLCETLDIIIKYKLNEHLQLLKYSDSDWVKDLNIRRFTLKYVFSWLMNQYFDN
jgi:hypothetical protein